MTQFPLENVLQGRWVFSSNCILDHILKDVRNILFLLNSYKTSGPSAQAVPLLYASRQMNMVAAWLLLWKDAEPNARARPVPERDSVLFRRPV